MKLQLVPFDIPHFLNEDWQQRPRVFRQAFSEFADIIDEHELAGLAQEDEVDSRIVRYNNGQWHVDHGPFTDFNQVCRGHWSLLVQSVDLYVPGGKALLDAFDFVPNWRKDDLMVSYSVVGGGVGPHVDQYDVFIVQGQGQRRWRVGAAGQFREFIAHGSLRHVDPFTPVIDVTLNPGDILYIPPGAPHEGVALSPCINYSVGFRAPSQAELLSDFADFALQSSQFQSRYTDPPLTKNANDFVLRPAELRKFKKLMADALNHEAFDQWLATYLSQNSHALENEEELSHHSANEVKSMLQNGAVFFKRPDVRYTAIPQANGNEYLLCVNGLRFTIEKAWLPQINKLLSAEFWPCSGVTEKQYTSQFVALLTKLINAGLWFSAE